MHDRRTTLRRLCLLVAGGLLLCVLACRTHVRYYRFLPVNPHGWSCTDTLRFELPADTTSSLNTFSLSARVTEQMEYQGLWLVLEQRFAATPNLQQPPPPRRDTLFIPMTRENGRWETSGVVIHEAEAICTAAQTIPDTPLTLLVYHIMPKQEISGVLEIGLKVE